jgi:ribose transport system permease protein
LKPRGKEIGIFIILLVLLTGTFIFKREVLSGVNLINTGKLIGMYGIMSLGMAFVIITGGIDLSIGSLIALFGVLLSMMLVDHHLSPVLSLIFILLGGALIGWTHGKLITKLKLQPFVVTLCGLLFYRGAARFISGDQTKGFGDLKGFEWVKSLSDGKLFGMIPVPFVLMVLIAAGMYFVLHRSVYGRHLFASGYNEESARYAGVNSSMVITIAYMICGVTTAIATVMFGFYTNSISPSTHGNFYELYAIAAAVLGGCSLRGGEGSILGVVLGTALLQVLRNIVNLLGIESSLEFAVMGIVIFIGVLLDTVLRQRTRPSKSADKT